MSKQERKVPEQKGPIHAAEMTSKHMTFQEKVAEREQQMREMRDGQTLKYHEPKK